jgi:alpha-mannosidase
MKGLELHILSHTHWDREWYRTFQEFRRQLVLLVDELLDVLENDPSFKHFHFDGQTIPIEDYLAIRPDREKRLTKLIRQGRISIGPWYVLNDHFLTHGESTIRNLQIGHLTASKYGKISKVGYMPDQFGLMSQAPQILKNAGIDKAVFARGYVPGEERKAEIQWKSPDGSKVFALFLANWYSNYMRPETDVRKAAAELKEAVEKIQPYSSTDYMLFFNGCDHLNVQAEMGQLVEKLDKHLSDNKVVHTRLEDFMKKLSKACRKPTVVEGERREDHNNQILAGTLSTRMYLKQANNRCESALLTAETLQALRHHLGGDYDRDYLLQAWKLLLQNHPHDSICGCSIDQVHREMMTRFDQVEQMAKEINKESMAWIAEGLALPKPDESRGVLVFNPTAIKRTEAVNLTIDFPISKPERKQNLLQVSSRIPQNISVFDEENNPVAFHVFAKEEKVVQILSREKMPHSVMVQQFHVQIPVELEPLEYRSFHVLPKKSRSARAKTSLRAGNNRLENEWVQVMVGGDGSISIRDRKTGHLYGPLLSFEDGGDVGDEYLYRCPENDRSVTTVGRPAQTRPVISTQHQGTLQIERIVPLPDSANLNEERRNRSTVDCLISTRISLYAGYPTLFCETRLENRALNHRLRTIFQSNLTTDRTYSDSPFDIIERPAALPEEWVDAARQFPLQSFVALENETQGMAIFTRGLHEYELTNTEHGTLALTLLRCVGHLSRARECHHFLETPEAQCQGIYGFEYAIHPYRVEEGRTDLPRLAEAFNRPVETYEFDPQKGGGLNRRQSLVSVMPEHVLVTAIKRCDERPGLLLRMVNMGIEKTETQVKTAFSLKEAHLLNVLEKRKKKIPSKRTGFEITMGPKQIVTVELEG